MKAKSKSGRSTPKPKGLTGRRAASNIFAGLESKRPQQFGKSFAKPVRQPNRRGGANG